LLTVLRAEAAAAGVPLSAYVNRKLRDNRLSAGYHASARWLAETDPGWDAFVEAATAEAWAKDCRGSGAGRSGPRATPRCACARCWSSPTISTTPPPTAGSSPF